MQRTVTKGEVLDSMVEHAITEAVMYTMEHGKTAFVYLYGSIACVATDPPTGDFERLVFITCYALCRPKPLSAGMRKWVSDKYAFA